MLERFRFRSLRRGWLALPLAVLLTPTALAQCPVAANCTPGPATDPFASLFGRGITRVTLGALNYPTPIDDGGYHDYCATGGTTTLFVGVTYPLTVTTAPGGAEIVRVWADFDNNGIFNPSTELVLASTATGVHTGTLTVPASAVLNTPLRLRVASDDVSSVIRTPCSSPEYSETEDYSFTVQTNTAPPTANFTAAADTVTCSGLVQFTDLSGGAPSTWAWDFGDGQTSVLQNPQHQYTMQNRYSVQLIVTNVNGGDTLIRTRYIRYDNQVPVAASCTPQTVAYCCGYGINRVRLATLDRSSANAAAGYEDFTCGVRATVVGGNSYQLRIGLAGTQPQDVRGWLDANNDGQFSAAEQIVTALNQTDSVTVTVTVPLTTPLATPLRLRIAADAAGQASGPCVNPQLGQVEDYTVVARANTLPPVAAFAVAPSTLCDTVKTFQDQSQNAPTSWHWDFGDGQTSTLQNPTHTYTQSGAFAVTLAVTNAFGTDTLMMTGATFVTTPCRNYCVPTNLQTASVWITNVQFAQIDRTSGLEVGAYAVTYNPPARLTQGQITTLSVTTEIQGGGMGPPQFTTSVWIDWDQDGTWTTAERVTQQQGDPNNSTVQQAVTVPTAATAGPTMMRVLTTRNAQFANNPCPPNGAPGIEIEDYLIVVSGLQAPPVANFLATDSVSCNGLVQFTDQSTNAPTAWRWNFGDGQTSTQQSPQHQYSPSATPYIVKLTVVNSFGTDSVTRVAVRVTGDPVPVAPSCRPESATPGFGLGIDSVRLAGGGQVLVNSTPDESDGYRDYTCGRSAEVYRSRTATLRVRSIQPMGARVVAWIDYDNNGDFQPATERILNANANGTNVVTFTVPATAVVDTPLRMRIGSDWANNQALRPCGGQAGMTTLPQYGQFEDYTVFVRIPVGVSAEREPLALSVLPNPTVDGRVTVRLTGDAGAAAGAPLTLTVRSMLGQVVARRTLTVRAGAEASLDLSALPHGVYSVQTDGATPALRGITRLVRD